MEKGESREVNTDEIKVLLPEIANKIAEAGDVDVIAYIGPIECPLDRRVASCCNQVNQRRANCLLVLATWGGDPHIAFRIARCLQQYYKRVTAFIPSYCKSAGTLLALGAHELVVGDFGDLGPLDIQVARRDEMGEMSSGLVVNEALVSLQKRAIASFTAILKSLKEESFGQMITLKTAMQTAREMTVGLLAPIYGQVEPMHLGELTRAMKITEHYGQRLSEISKNLKKEALQKLVAAYPSHYVSIDRLEAKNLFVNVREPSELEAALAIVLHDMMAVPPDEIGKSFVAQLSKPRENTHEAATNDARHPAGAGEKNAQTPRRTRKKPNGGQPAEPVVAGTNGRERRTP